MAFKLPGIDFKPNVNTTHIVDFGAKNSANTPTHALGNKLTSINNTFDLSGLGQRGVQNLSHQLWSPTPGSANTSTGSSLSARLTNIKNTIADGFNSAFGRKKEDAVASPTSTPTNTTGMRGLVTQFFAAPIDTIALGFTQGFKALNIGKESLLASGLQAITHTRNAATELSNTISNKADAMNVRQEVAVPIENFFGTAAGAIKAAPKKTLDFLKGLLPSGQGTATLKQADLVGSDSQLADAGGQSLVGGMLSSGFNLAKDIFLAPFTLGSKLANVFSGADQPANLDQHRIPTAEEVRQIQSARPFENG